MPPEVASDLPSKYHENIKRNGQPYPPWEMVTCISENSSEPDILSLYLIQIKYTRINLLFLIVLRTTKNTPERQQISYSANEKPAFVA